jgi:hypothetical protein
VPQWMPTVDPFGTMSVYWEGSLALDESGVTVRPGAGRLVLGPWAGGALDGPVQELAAGISAWEARWDPTGTRFALWVADAADPAIGRLGLFVVDRVTGLIDEVNRPLRDVPALPGFSLADGRLAWATPPGQDGQGSRVQVLAWVGHETGTVETLPGDHGILIIR